LFYYLRIRTPKRLYFGLREIPILKNILLASIWTVATIYIPFREPSINSDTISIFIVRFSYIFVLCLMSDNRDIEYDKAKGITTISLILGNKKTKYLIISILIGISIYVLLQSSTTTIWTSEAKLALIISCLLTLATIFLLEKNTKVRKATLMIDGNLLIHGLLLPIISCIHF
jgi:4-hydroxybenzoate polyprenyltransferase